MAEMPSFRLPPIALRLLRDTTVFLAVLAVLHLLVEFAGRHYTFGAPRWWPLSIFNPRSPLSGEILLAAVVAVGFALMILRLERTRYRSLAEAAVFGTLLILGTNGIQGTKYGFVQPTAGGTIQYYHDAGQHTESPLVFLRHFYEIQPTLGDHGRTHPPGAILLLRLLREITGDNPAAISVLIAVTASLLSAYFFRLLLSDILPTANSNAGAFLLLLLPAVQIYYCATLDAVIASLLLGTVSLFSLSPSRWTTAFAAACLLAASFLTYGFVWVLPLLVVTEMGRWDKTRSILRLSEMVAPLIYVYLSFDFLTGFDYLFALRTAAHLENPYGFWLLAEPLSYFFTRLEDVCEIVIFTGPVLLSLILGNVRGFVRDQPLAGRLFWTAIATLGVLFLTGAYRTGETARACLFLFPYLLLPILGATESDSRRFRWLMAAVFGQALLMQLLGRYFW